MVLMEFTDSQVSLMNMGAAIITLIAAIITLFKGLILRAKLPSWQVVLTMSEVISWLGMGLVLFYESIPIYPWGQCFAVVYLALVVVGYLKHDIRGHRPASLKLFSAGMTFLLVTIFSLFEMLLYIDTQSVKAMGELTENDKHLIRANEILSYFSCVHDDRLGFHDEVVAQLWGVHAEKGEVSADEALAKLDSGKCSLNEKSDEIE